MKRNFLFSFFIVAEVILSSGCGTQQEIPKTTAFYQVVDSAGRTVELEKKPNRVVLLATAFPEILLAVDGDFEAWANNPSIKEPAWARGKKTVGYVYDINIESVVAMNPDLVVGLVGLHNKLEAVFKTNNIPFLLLSLSRYEDVENAIQVLADSTGHHEKGIKVVTAIRERMAITEKKMPDKGLTCAILHGTARSLTFEGEETIAGETAKRLHISNVFAGMFIDGTNMVPFNLEALVEKNPDIIFLTTMMLPGKEEEAFKVFFEQPAWAGLEAVQTGRVYFLPQNLFLSSPGIHYPEALEIMANLAYEGDLE